MDSASLKFVLFGLAVALVSNLSRSRAWRSAVAMLASILFLGMLARNPIVLLPLTGFLLLGYAGMLVTARNRSRFMASSIIIVVFAYIWLKKYTFLPESIFLRHPYFTLGLSYIFFRVIHLVIESGAAREGKKIGFGAYLLYTINFTTLVSGPIQWYDEFAEDQFALEPISLGPRVIGLQLERIIRGFFKVNVLAMLLHGLQEDALMQMSQPVTPATKIYAAFKLTVLYPFFLYCNFSGYIDIVIAIARLMRVRLPENFDRPFSAASFIDFWSRWHITLSTWLKTYVYNPLLLALMRRTSSPTAQSLLGVFSFFVTFFLVGLWHGRTAGFIFFGVLQGGGVAINKLWQIGMKGALGRKGYKSLTANSIYIAFARGLTFSWFSFTLYWFWAGWGQIREIFAALSVGPWLGVWLMIWLTATLALEFWELLQAALLAPQVASGPLVLSRYARVVYASALGFISLVIILVLNQPAPDIVYKAF